ncbi:ScyD/ScyE family protein [Streptomyces sp. NPDC091292]|uniref:ScyD/ScyE family protein n=1 Tax=Streptomyces sp. NPDC091292 TaxID=3365991 RepID=UPI0038000521
MLRRLCTTTLAAALLTATLTSASSASSSSPPLSSGSPHSSSPRLEVVADHLVTPRGLTWDARQHRVLVTEAGKGGPAPCAAGVGGYPACFGATGAITAYTPRDDKAVRIAQGLPSVINEFSVLGLHDIDASDGRISVVFGLGGHMSTRVGLGEQAHGLAQTGVVDRAGKLRPIGDLLAFEEKYNPHPADVNANAYGLTRVPGGTLVAEAGGNGILRVGDNGSVKLVAALPDQIIDGATVESVPTAITPGPDGAFYISEYSGEPTRIGVARIWRLVPGKSPVVVARGFTGVIDLAFDRQGRMLVLELAEKGFDDPDRTGRLIRVERDGRRTVLAREGLEHPGGVAVAPNGDIYLTNRTTSLGEATGQLLRLRSR